MWFIWGSSCCKSLFLRALPILQQLDIDCSIIYFTDQFLLALATRVPILA